MDGYKVEQERLEDFCRNKPEVIAVYVHGSRVKGNAVASSDTDVAVMVEKKPANIKQQLELTSEIGSFVEPNPDVRVVDRDSSAVFLFNVVRDGKVIYKRSETDRVRFEVVAMRSYYDTENLRRIYRRYLYPVIKEAAYGN